MKENFAILAAFFAAHPTIGAIVCNFEGSGDSGQLEGAIAVEEWADEMLDSQAFSESGPQPGMDVRKAAEDIVYSALEKQGVDWYNNDGGFGVCAITKDGAVHLQTNQRYTETTSHTAAYSIKDDGLETREES